jgi:hypothetical protein
MNKRLRKVLRGDVERLVCSNVASGNVHNVEELANVATETMLLRQRLAMMEDRLRSEYNRALADSDHTYRLTVKLVLEPKETEDQAIEKVLDDLKPTEEHKRLCKAFDE